MEKTTTAAYLLFTYKTSKESIWCIFNCEGSCLLLNTTLVLPAKTIYEEQNLPGKIPSAIREVKLNRRVDINDLLARARKIEEKEYKTNLVFFALISALILVVGLILSF